MPVRIISAFILIILLTGCQDEPESKPPAPPPARISYSLEVRPWFIKNCLACHGNLPLHAPGDWDPLHDHRDDTRFETPEFVKLWVKQGSIIDPHWAGLPLRTIKARSLDDLIKSPGRLLPAKRKKVPPMFTAPVADLLAGDLMEDRRRTISTGYLRKGDDTPEWRIEKVAREFMGVRVGCAGCHDHPAEQWSTARYQAFKELFTTPYDHLPKALPPLYIERSEKDAQRIAELQSAIAEARNPIPVPAKEFDLWKESAGNTPQLPGLLAAYSFDDRQLTNLAPIDRISANGNQLISEAGAHGLGIYFDGKNKLTLNDVPIASELDPFTISAWIQAKEQALADTPILTIGKRDRGFELRLLEGRLQARWVKVWPQFAIAVTSKAPVLTPGRWAHLAVTYDGSRQARGLKLYLNGHAIDTTQPGSSLFQQVLTSDAVWNFAGAGITLDELQIYGTPLTQIGIRQLFDGTSLGNATPEELRIFFQRHFANEITARNAQLRKLNEALLEIENRLPVYLVMSGTPKSESLRDSSLPKDRLEFARGLNRDLLARSLANEVWRQHFGSPLAHGLGFSDLPPLNPEVLEWLASQLKSSNFDLVKLGEVITASKTWLGEWPQLEHQPVACPRPEK